jgi:predicted ATPase
MSSSEPNPSKLRFIAVLWRWMVEPRDDSCVILERGRPWDDHGYRTLFQLHYLPAGSDEPRHIGAVKILQRGVEKTELPEQEFDCLDERFCSLGQSTDYYLRLHELGQDVAEAILCGLRDVVLQPQLREQFENDPGLEISLMRSLGARTALQEAGALLAGRQPKSMAPFRFHFECPLQAQGFSEPHHIDVEFFPEDRQLGRVFCLVGKNATGKSALLSALAGRLSGLDREAGTISPLPSLDRVIVIAYSAFDRYGFYQRDRPKGGVAYHYCGLRDEKGNIDVEKAFEHTERRLKRLDPDRWRDVLLRSGILDTEAHLAESVAAGDVSAFIEQMKSLSSGHQTILFVLSNLMATIRPRSLILFDEPEMHLHPNLLSSLMRLLHVVLDEFDSYAVLSTHSPQIAQEIPARSICIIERCGMLPSTRPYPRESFGANLGEIAHLAFGVNDSNTNYQRILIDNAKTLGREWLMDRVDEVLSEPLGLGPHALLDHLRQSDAGDEES